LRAVQTKQCLGKEQNMLDRRTTWRRAVLGIAAAGVVITTAGLGSAAAEPVVPPPGVNAHFVAPGKPVFFEADGLTGAKYHSASAAEPLTVTCRNLVTIGEGPAETLGTATTFMAFGTFGGQTVERGFVQNDSVVLHIPADSIRPC
jgi:hypothetical protein